MKLCDGAQMVNFWRFLRPVVSDLHSKFALRPHHVWKYGRHPLQPLRLGEEERRRKIAETTGQKYNVCICYAGWP